MAIESRDPGTGELIESYEPFGDNRIEAAVADAQTRFAEWRLTPVDRRAALLARAGDVLEAGRDKYAELASREMGKTLREARAEIEKCAWACRHYAESAADYLERDHADVGKSDSYIDYQPLGPLLAVMPWNFPFWQVFRFGAPAIAAGNVVLLKHASNVPGSALAIEEVFREAGFPEHVFQTLLIGADRVAKIIADRRVAGVSLTGSTGAGAKVAEQAGSAIKPTVLELGGSDPFIVMPSADFDGAVETGLKARMMNNGQSCINAKRFIVHEDVYDRYLDAFVARTEALKVGYQLDEDTDIGPLALKSIRDEVAEQVDKSVAAGARKLVDNGGGPSDGYYFAPTVLAEVPQDAPAYREELFGPVATFFKAADMDEAIALANDSPFGLGAAVWTREEAETRRFVRDLEAGAVFVNLQVASDPRMPFGGIKESGYGRELGRHGMLEFVNAKTVVVA